MKPRHEAPQYQRGDRIQLVHTSDPYTDLRPGASGTVLAYDTYLHSLDVLWDTGSNLTMLLRDGDRVRHLGTSALYPAAAQAKPGDAELLAAAAALARPVALLEARTGTVTWTALGHNSVVHTILHTPPGQARTWPLHEGLQLVWCDVPETEPRYNALTAHVSAFVGRRIVHCYSDAVITGCTRAGCCVPVAAGHVKDLIVWMQAAGIGPDRLHVRSGHGQARPGGRDA